MTMKIYVASSWRCHHQPIVVGGLRDRGYDVYDFKNPGFEDHGFHWSEIDPNWKNWTTKQFIEGLKHPIAQRGFDSDMNALRGCDACVLVLECGRSAHLEAGWAQGAGKPLLIYIPGGTKLEPELMYKMAHGVYGSLIDLYEGLKTIPVSERFPNMATINPKRHLP